LANTALITLLAYGHILSAVGWLGGGLLTGFVVGPGLQKMSAPARFEFLAKVIPKMIRYVGGMIGGTFIFGLFLLYFFVDGDFSRLSPSTPFGAAMSAGIALAVLTAVIAAAVTFPSFGRMSRIAGELLKSGQQPPPELMKYAARARMGSVAGAVLLLVVLATMVTAGFY